MAKFGSNEDTTFLVESPEKSTKKKNRFESQYFINEIKQHFNLRNPKGNKPTLVYFVVKINREQIRLSTKCKVYPTHWDNCKAKEGNLFTLIENNNNRILNEQIDIYNKRFEEYKYLANCGHIEINKATLKHYIYNGTMMTEKKETIDICRVIRSYLNKDTGIRDSTKTNYFRFIDKFDAYLKTTEINGFAEINSKLFRGFQEWLKDNVSGGGKNTKAKPQSINKIVNCMLTIIKRYLVINEHITGSQFNDIVVADLREINVDDKIALLDDELMMLYNYKCDNKRDEEIRDLFLLECTTGQRISDIDKVANNIEHKGNRTYINIVQDKTTEKVQVDIIFEIALEIIAKYDEQLPTYNRKIFNQRIKEIAKNAGITGIEEIRQQQVDKSEIVVESKERFNCISSHTGRRTFATLLSLRGWHYSEIARYSGHNKLEMVQLYDKSKKGTKVKVMFEELKKNHPDQLLKMVNDNQEPQTSKIAQVDVIQPQNNSNDLESMLKQLLELHTPKDTKTKVDNKNNVLFDTLFCKRWTGIAFKSYCTKLRGMKQNDQELTNFNNAIATIIKDINKPDTIIKMAIDDYKPNQDDYFKLRSLIGSWIELKIDDDIIFKYIERAKQVGIDTNGLKEYIEETKSYMV